MLGAAGNHPTIFKRSGIAASQYRYWDPKTRGLDISGLVEDIQAAPDRSIILLHSCAHNPTGQFLENDTSKF